MLKYPLIKQLRRLWDLFDQRERWQVVGILCLMLMGTFLEALGIGLILPLITALEKPEVLNNVIFWRTESIPLSPQEQRFWLIVISSGFGALYLVKNVYLTFSSYIQIKFLIRKQLKFSTRLFNNYLFKPYTFHLQHNTSTLIQRIGGEVSILFTGVLFHLLVFVAEVAVVSAIVGLLIANEPLISLIVVACLSVLTLVFYKLLRRKISQAGKIRLEYGQKITQNLLEGLGAVKEVKVLQRENFFLDDYIHNFQISQSSNLFLLVANVLPRFYIETLAIVSLVLIIVVGLLQDNNISSILPTVSLFAVAAFRLMPSVGRIMGSMNSVIYSIHAVDAIYDDYLESTHTLPLANQNQESESPNYRGQLLGDRIELLDVHYQYPQSDKKSLDGVSLKIHQGEMVGFVGSSGAGKTTVIDVILGLLRPSQGDVQVDGQSIYENLGGWQRQIGYIPQAMFLSDDTLRNNIAFGLSADLIDETALMTAVRAAQLEDFVAELPQGLDTMVGERGVRLSGGQRQRIGIARAIYHNPSVLVMDEATAALDNQTEAGVMEAVQAFSGEKTILIIAHRLSTVMNCDRLYLLDKGQIIAQGTYRELLETSPQFQAMARSYGQAEQDLAKGS
ncbi:ABC transporter ATP-binding protein/permease [Candidatus Synechococcus calcipolaris G9]|uniref:ABC transporter ATP-binding protein/permease n=1 Tax=Candidatus Synechococcus calcipolaris G9 TaxID=1497997 RepID=A0ABT6F2Z9_9SYNE|nr:ABC transporter ATP-binding protein [Candidatus Synechococcus calcipolaris]MDG2992209.1 ABC transporter ATP-binding protein/permease [Candidatus Synechococcus calcipolaris G9]